MQLYYPLLAASSFFPDLRYYRKHLMSIIDEVDGRFGRGKIEIEESVRQQT
ncbi:hypothetical protein AM1_A0310 (plasmid) [Acaryochloris marina MBIC11017]|uniref:Uncharacterized protein n=1 Tax=Acaryochloris marina (strain MBIC 11017) TaxID=329726 RepID=A8ZKW0_ACAM1|nr:hypothetical protein AM1_A0310 [Acaryochloris marina MBIC11017]